MITRHYTKLLLILFILLSTACGGGGGGGGSAPEDNLTSPDTVPNDFSFEAQSNVPVSTWVFSNSVTISGIDTATSISIENGDYSVNDGPFIGADGSVSNGDEIIVRAYSSPDAGATEVATLTVGGVKGSFSVTTGSDNEFPQASVTFPSSSEFTVTEPEMMIKGTASDDSGIAAVYVNDTLATTDDDFATWQAAAYFAIGATTEVSIKVKDIYGNITQLDPLQAKVPARVELQHMDSIAWDSTRGKLYTSGYVSVFDPDTGIRSNMPQDTDDNADWARFILYDNSSARLFGFNGSLIIEYDRDTGELIGNTGIYHETQSSNVYDVALDASLGRIYWIGDFELRYYDLNTDTETLLSNDGSILGRNSRLAAAGGRVFVSDSGSERLYEIDVALGTKSLIFNSVDWDHVESMAATASGDMLYVVADGATARPYPTAYQVNPDTAAFAHLAPASTTGEEFNFNLQSADIVLDETNNRALISASRSGHIVKIDLADASVSWLLNSQRGSGIPIAGENTLRPLALDIQNNRALVASSSYVDAYAGGSATDSSKLVAANLQTGDRLEHSGPTRGSGPLFDGIDGVDVGPSGTAYVLDSTVDGGAIISVNPTTGDRSIVTSENTDLGIAMGGATRIRIASDEQTAWYLDNGNSIVAVDLLSGSGSVLTDGTGTYAGGDNWSGITEMDIDKEAQTAYVFGNVSGTFRLFQVNLETGTRTVLNPNLTLGISSPWSILYRKSDNSILLASSSLYRFDIESESLEQIDIMGISMDEELGGLVHGETADRAYFTGVFSRFVGELDMGTHAGAVISW